MFAPHPWHIYSISLCNTIFVAKLRKTRAHSRSKSCGEISLLQSLALSEVPRGMGWERSLDGVGDNCASAANPASEGKEGRKGPICVR